MFPLHNCHHHTFWKFLINSKLQLSFNVCWGLTQECHSHGTLFRHLCLLSVWRTRRPKPMRWIWGQSLMSSCISSQPTSIGSNTTAEGETKLGRVPSLRDFSTKALVGSLPRTKLFIARSQPVKSALLSSLVLQASLATGFWHLEVSEFGFEGAISVVLAWRTALLLRASRRIRMSSTEPTLVEPGYDITLVAILLLTGSRLVHISNLCRQFSNVCSRSRCTIEC